jgi:hypothetical protein
LQQQKAMLCRKNKTDGGDMVVLGMKGKTLLMEGSF